MDYTKRKLEGYGMAHTKHKTNVTMLGPEAGEILRRNGPDFGVLSSTPWQKLAGGYGLNNFHRSIRVTTSPYGFKRVTVILSAANGGSSAPRDTVSHM